MEIEIKKVLCPVDFSDSSSHALRYAVAFAGSYEAEMTLLHVVELPIMPSYSTPGMPDLAIPVDRMREDAGTALEEWAQKARALCPSVQTTVTVGTPFLEIIRVAREMETDLIVVGTHGRAGLKHVLIGSVAEKVVRKAPCPVLTVKLPEHEFVMP